MLDAIFTSRSSTIGVCTTATLGAYPWQVYVQSGDVHWPTPGMYRVDAPDTTLSRGSLMLLNQLFPSHPIYMVGHTALEAWQSHPIPLHGGEVSSFPGLV